MASDFVLGRFYFLRRLLLLHGFWCYERISRMILYFFYKNAVSVIDKTQNAFQGITSCVEVFQDTFLKVSLKICFLENYIHRYLYLLLLECFCLRVLLFEFQEKIKAYIQIIKNLLCWSLFLERETERESSVKNNFLINRKNN